MLNKTTLITLLLFFVGITNAQTTINFGCTGAPVNFVVPACVTSIIVSVSGAEGGGGSGGLGAVVTGTIPVTPGQTLQVIVGCTPTGAGAGYNGGGSGQGATSAGDPSFGGGGASSIGFSPFGPANQFIVAGGGGGQGGGTADAIGGDGGCAAGGLGAAPFGVGGQGGTQVAGGAGGGPWIASGNWGLPGGLGLGGNGATDPCYNNSPGGGGGGGYFGGGGGGSDCYASPPYGGGGGGGGSSLTPAGGGCTAGSNAGSGAISITYTCILPIELISFTGKSFASQNELYWITATEINNKYFLLESSPDGKEPFDEIQRMYGAGNSNTEKSYDFIDKNPYAIITYYRLKQIDFDGKFTYSNIIALKTLNDVDVAIYPNPSSGSLYFDITSDKDETYTIFYSNVLGKSYKEKFYVSKGSNKYQLINFSQLAAGFYFIQLLNDNGEVIKHQKIVKTKRTVLSH
jgi:hypothetical protein